MTQLRLPDELQRRALRVLRMVHELHKIGHQRLRIMPGLSPSGTHWRCGISYAGNVLADHGAWFRRFTLPDTAVYSSGQSNQYFGWTDAAEDTADDLAAKFLERFAGICYPSAGRDWAYAGWFVEMLGHAEYGYLPVSYSEAIGYNPRRQTLWLPTINDDPDELPMPPPGEFRV